MAETDDEYARCRYSVRCHTTDLAVVHCIRALAEFSEQGVHKQISWGGTKEADWRASHNHLSVRFSDPKYRDVFIATAARLLPEGSWTAVGTRDDDPATRQRQK